MTAAAMQYPPLWQTPNAFGAPGAFFSRVEIWRGSAKRSVSRSRSSNRTCSFPASGFRTESLAGRPQQGGSHLSAFATAYRSFMIRNAQSGLLDIRVPRDRGSMSHTLLTSLLTLNQGPFAPRSLLASWLLLTSPSPRPAGPVPRRHPVAVLLRADLGFPC
jgi:hypothetical protein